MLLPVRPEFLPTSAAIRGIVMVFCGVWQKETFQIYRRTGMFRTMAILAATLVGAGLLAPGAPARAAFISNGDFETLDAAPGDPVFANWSNNAGVTLASQAIGSSNSARVALNTASLGNALAQTADDPGAELDVFSVGFDFAASNPGGTTARSMQLVLRTAVNVNSGNINLRVVNGTVPGMGTVQVFNQGTSGFATVLANVVNFSTSETGSGFVANSATIAGDFSGAIPSYTVTVNGNSSAPLSFFQGSAPAQGSPLMEISFQSGNIVAGAWSVVDDVVVLVPEPASVGLFGLGALGLLARRRRA